MNYNSPSKLVALKQCLFTLTLAITLVACGSPTSDDTDDTNTSDPARGDFITATWIQQVSISDINLKLSARLIPLTAQYNVDIYNVVYRTLHTDGSLINASGRLAIPQKTAGSTSPVMIAHHATIAAHENAPTVAGNIEVQFAASQGYIALAPDYIGFGSSADKLHPYLHAESLADASIDMLRATREITRQLNVLRNGQLFLTGYSEGGYATVATHRAMQTLYSSEFSITATVAGAGPYDLLNTANFILNQTTFTYAAYPAFLLKAYNTVYGLDRLAEIFSASDAPVIAAAFDGTQTFIHISTQLSNTPGELFQPQFLADFLADGEASLKLLLDENTLLDWTPQAPIRLVHGQGDLDVPFLNAENAISTWQSNGATDVALAECTGGSANHVDCYNPYLYYVFNTLGNL